MPVDKVVEHDDRLAASAQVFDDDAADIACSACDEDSHYFSARPSFEGWMRISLSSRAMATGVSLWPVSMDASGRNSLKVRRITVSSAAATAFLNSPSTPEISS